MRNSKAIQGKIVTADAARRTVSQWRLLGKTVAFTNGCFDILHEGHIASLSQAAESADRLIVGLNSDASIKKLKGNDRPVNNEHSRALLLASLQIVDLVVVFSDDTPLALIQSLLPDVLVKGGDYKVDEIAGAKEVIAHGGRVEINPLVPGLSTTGLIQKIKLL